MPKDDLVTMFGYQVRVVAEGQRRRVKEFPADQRYQKAADKLERLYTEIEELCGLSIEEDISDLDVRLREADQKVRIEIEDNVSKCLSSIGFDDDDSLETGLSLVEWYRDLLQDKLRT
jgi:hypothetical protein